jgi:eRF1 domain 2
MANSPLRTHRHRLASECLQVAEQTTQYFITNDRPNVAGLVLAGSADFKTELGQSDMFDQRLKAIILLTVDVSYGEHLHYAISRFSNCKAPAVPCKPDADSDGACAQVARMASTRRLSSQQAPLRTSSSCRC